jgi:hypothetical protein
MTTTVKVKDAALAAKLFTLWVRDTLEPTPEMIPKFAGFLLTQSAYILHRLGLQRDMFLYIAAQAWPPQGPGHVVGVDGRPQKERLMNEYDLSELWVP